MRFRIWLLPFVVPSLAGCPAARSESPVEPTGMQPAPADSTTLAEDDFDGSQGVFGLLPGRSVEGPPFATTTMPPPFEQSPGMGGDADPGASVPDRAEFGMGLQRDAVQQVLLSQAGRLRACHDRLLVGAATETTGRVSIRFHVEPSGVVRQAEVASATIEDPTFQECVRGVVRGLRFPSADAPTIVVYPFRFEGPAAGAGAE